MGSARGVTTARHPEIAVRNGLSRSWAIARLPGGAFVALLALYDGHWLTLRAHHPTADRRWIGPGPFVHPLATLIEHGGLPWDGGGAVVPDDSAGMWTWVGPPGWLPDVPAGGLVGLQLRNGTLRAEAVELTEDLASERATRVRAAVSRHLPPAWRAKNGRWLGRHYVGSLDGSPLMQLGQAVERAAIEEPAPFREPGLPLGEVLRVPDAIETAWVDIPDPWVRHAHHLRQELRWMEEAEPSTRARLEELDDPGDWPPGGVIRAPFGESYDRGSR